MAQTALRKVLDQLRKTWAAQAARDIADSELLRRFIVDREDAAFTVLVQRHGPMVINICKRVLGDYHAAEDAFQATFVVRGKSHEQAAHELRVPKRTVTSRVVRGRELLREQLVRRGITLSAGVVATALCEKVSGAPVGAMLTINTVKAATSIAAGRAVAVGCLSAGAKALAEEAIAGTVWLKAKLILLVLTFGVVVGGASIAGYVGIAHKWLAAGASLAIYQARLPSIGAAWAQELAEPPKQPAPKPSAPKEQPRLDILGDPLPAGAIARIGTTRFLGGGYLAFTANGKLLISADENIVFWDAGTGKERRRLEIQGPPLCTFVLSPDGKLLATVDGKHIRFWDVGTGKEIQQLTYESSAPAVDFSPDGKSFAASKGDGKIQLWDVATWQPKESLQKGGTTLQIPKLGELNYRSLPDGKSFISIWEINGRTALTWHEALAGEQRRRLVSTWGNGSAMALSPDGMYLAGIVKPGEVFLCHAMTGKEIERIKLAADVKDTDACLCFSPDSQILACHFGPLQETLLFASNNGKEIGSWKDRDRVDSMVFSPDGKILARSTGRRIDLRDALTGKPALDLADLPEKILSVAFLDSNSLVAGYRDGGSASWDVVTGKRIAANPAPMDGPIPFSKALNRVSFSPDIQLAASLDPQDRVMVWSTVTGKTVSRIDSKPVSIGFVRFSPDGTALVMPAERGVITIWDTASGALRHRLTTNLVFHCAFSQDGKRLATATGALNSVPIEKAIRVWNTLTGETEFLLPLKHDGVARSFAFSPDGNSLLSFHVRDWKDGDRQRRDSTMCLWNLRTAKEMKRFPGPAGTDFAGCHALSPDFRTVALSTPRGAVLCELATGQVRGRFSGYNAFIIGLQFSPNGRLLASASGDETALVWDVTGLSPSGKLLPRDLSPAEIELLWAALAETDGVKAYRAMWTLVAGARQAVPFLAQSLQPAVPADSLQLAQLIANLDSEQFKIRTQATKDLRQLGDLAEPALRAALEGKITLETRQRLQQLLDEFRDRPLFPRQLQILRAIETLENDASPAARQQLQTLASGAPGAMQTKEARASLERLRLRGKS